MKQIEIVSNREPEYQCLAPDRAIFDEVRFWILERGGQPKKKSKKEFADKPDRREVATYLDTKKFCLLSEGLEYRIKGEGKECRHDMKLPINPNAREVVPDENGVIERLELKFKAKKAPPSLKNFERHAALDNVNERLNHKFFGMKIEEMFDANFIKHKIDLFLTSTKIPKWNIRFRMDI